MNNKEFFNMVENQTFWEKYFINGQIAEWNKIITEWGYSSVQLKKWLNKYFPLDDKNWSSKLASINVNRLLPYRKNGFLYGKEAIYRLELALKAKLIILGTEYGLDESRTIYAVEALRLWLRIDSTRTDLSWKGFTSLVDKCYIQTELHWYETVELLLDKCEQYKSKRKQVMYHYKAEDFWCVNKEQTLNEAYTTWLKFAFPSLLDNFKKLKIDELYTKELSKVKYGGSLNYEVYNNKLNKLNDDLDLIQIKKPNIEDFRHLLKKFNIEYNKRKL